MSDFNRDIEKFIDFYKQYPLLMERATVSEARKSANKMSRTAQQLANFRASGRNSPSLAPEMNRSIQGRVEKKGQSIQLKFWIDPTFVTKYGKDGTAWNITWIHNDGTGQSYGKGDLSPAVVPRLKSTGMRGKYFMDRAWEAEYPNLQKAIAAIPMRIANKFLK